MTPAKDGNAAMRFPDAELFSAFWGIALDCPHFRNPFSDWCCQKPLRQTARQNIQSEQSPLLMDDCPINWNLSYQNINNNKSHQKCRKIAVQILLVLIKTKLKIQLTSKTVMNPPLVNTEIKISP